MKKALSAFLTLALVLALAVPAASAAGTSLSLQKKYTVPMAEESYNTPPVVVDLDGDGRLEVLHGAYSLTVADAATGQIKWQVNSGRDRTTPYAPYQHGAGGMFCKFIVRDFNADGKNEIALGYSDGTISLLSSQGYFMPGFPVKVPSARIHSLAADDVDGDGRAEIIAGISSSAAAAVSVYVYGCDGKLKPGWPQMQEDTAHNLKSYYSWLVCNDGIATGDMDGDGLPEIVVPTDNNFVSAYNGDGSHVMADSSVFKSEGDLFDLGGQIPWCAVGLYEDYSEELRRANGGFGWGLAFESLADKGRKGTYGPGQTYATAAFADVDGDGTQEVVLATHMFDRTVSLQSDGANPYNVTHIKYSTVYVFNGDHTRLNQNGCDWTSIPTNLTSPLGPCLNQNPTGGDGYTRNLGNDVYVAPVVGDINGDGVQEILFNSFDGKVHCFSAKDSSKELAGWPYTLPGTGSGSYEYPTAPVLADVNGDGRLEVVLASWTETANSKHPALPRTGRNGSIYVLDGSGRLLAQQKLDDMGTYDNVVRAKPVVADIDGDKQMEVLVNSSDFGGLIAYDVVGGTPAQPSQPAQKLADARDQKVIINGADTVTLHAFGLKDAKGNYTNYVSVRDLAWAMSNALGEGSGVFDVSWDSEAKAINLVTGKSYSNPTGNEGKVIFTGSQPYNQDPVKILVDGREVKLELINIGNGNTYYKLRDLGSALGIFDVDWDGAAGAVTINTK